MPREVTRVPKRERRPVRKAPSPSPIRPPAAQGVSELLLDLQRTAGNQAVNRFLGQYAAPQAKAPARPAAFGVQISRRTPNAPGFGTNPHVVDAPGDVPGTQPRPSPQVGAVTELRIDGDGDQQKELLLRIKVESTWSVWSEARNASVVRPKKVGLEVVQISSQAAQKLDFLLEGLGDFFPLVAAVTDGKAPTVISLTKPSTGQQGMVPGDRLLIYPPTDSANGREYRAEATGQSAAILLPMEAAPDKPVASAGAVGTVSGMGLVEDMSVLDITLGAYGDRFRLAVLPTAPDRARLNLYALGGDARAAGDGVEIALTGPFSLRVIDTGPVSLGLDLNGDGKPEIQIYDQLDSPKSALGESAPGSARNHRIRVTGLAVGADALFPFTVRAGELKGGMSSIGGITALDIALGAYGDQFRLTVQPTGPDSAHFGISSLRDDGKPVNGKGVEIKLTGPLSVQAIDTGPTGLGLDLNGDNKPEIQIVDLLGSAADTQGFTVDQAASPGLAGHDFAAYRFHDLRVSGPAIGAESVFHFDLNPSVVDDPAATANALAIDTLAKQAKEGDIQQRLDAAEGAMAAIRARAAKAGIIRQEVFNAWSALSVDLIKIEPRIMSMTDLWAAMAKGSNEVLRQFKVHTVPPALQSAAATHAAAFIQALTGTKDEKDDASPMSWFFPDLAGWIKSGEWSSVFREYKTLVGILDDQIADGLAKKAEEREDNWRPEDGSETPEADDLEQVKQIGAQKKILHDLGEHNAKRVLASFFPDPRYSGEQGFMSDVPLSLYYWKEKGENGLTTWYLKDITNPEKEHHYTYVTASDENEKGPPAGLLKELNDPDRFPKGRIHYQIPDGGGGELAVTDHLTWRKFWAEVLKWLMVASVVLDPFEIALLPVATRVAMFISAAGDLLRNYDQGDFDAGTAVVDIVQIVSALAGTSAQALGKIETEGAVFARMALRHVDTAANVTLFATFTIDTAVQLDEIEHGPGTRAEKDRAKHRLLAQYAATGILTAVSIQGMPSEPGGGQSIRIRPSEAGRPATAEIAGEEAGPAGSRAPSAKDEVTQVDAKSPFADDPTQVDEVHPIHEGSAMQGATPQATREMYENSMHTDPYREMQLVRNVDTGEIMVIQGEEGRVEVDKKHVWKEMGKPGRWVADRHIHPADPQTRVTPFHDYLPSSTGGDLSALEAESKMLGGQARVSRIDLTTPHGPDYTEIGYNPRAKRPYTVDYPDPVNGRRIQESFKSREAYEEWYSETFPGRRADIETAPAGGTHSSAPSRSGTPGSGGKDAARADISDLGKRFSIPNDVLEVLKGSGIDPKELEPLLARGVDAKTVALVADMHKLPGIRALDALTRSGVDVRHAEWLIGSAGDLDAVVQLADSGAIKRLLTKGMDAKDLGPLLKEVSKPGIEIADALVAARVDPPAAAETAKLATKTGTLDEVHILVVSGKLGNLQGLRSFLRKMIDNPPLRAALREAADRAAKGHEVDIEKALRAVDPTTGKLEDVKSGGEPWKADVLDHTAQEAMQVKEVQADTAEAVAQNVNRAANQLTGVGKVNPEVAPPGYSRIVKVILKDGSTNVLVHADRDTILRSLRTNGVSLASLTNTDNGVSVTEVQIVNATGTHTFHPSDF